MSRILKRRREFQADEGVSQQIELPNLPLKPVQVILKESDIKDGDLESVLYLHFHQADFVTESLIELVQSRSKSLRILSFPKTFNLPESIVAKLLEKGISVIFQTKKQFYLHMFKFLNEQ